MNKKAFTLIELLAVIVIIGILGIITVPNVLEYFNESKRQTMIVQESKLVESGDILVRDFCKKPINDNYRIQCDEVFKSLNSTEEENVVDDDPLTYTRYICVSTLKDKEYYSEKLQYSGEECSGVVVYRIDEETDIQKDSFSVIKCGSGYKTLFENESVEEFEENPEDKTRADELIAVFKECFPAGSDEEEEEPSNTPKEYQLTINFTEHNQYGQQVAETISEKVLQGNSVTKNVPPYYSYDGTNEEHFTPFVHGSSDDVLNNSGNKVKPTIVNDKLNFIMPANNVTINIAYSINQYTVTFNHIDAVLGTSTIGGQNYNSNSYKLFNGESVNIPYKEIPNFKIVSHNKVTQTNYLLNEHNDKTIDIKYQQINFNVTYDSNGGTACATVQKEYKKNFGTLCTTTRKGYTFAGWYLDGTKITSDTINNTYDNITLRANWTANEYQITYHMGNGTSTQGHTVLGTKTCVFDQTCTLDTFASLNKPFLYSSDPNYGWKFAGWTNFENTMEVKYANGLSFTYDKDYNLDLYAMGKRSLNINRGIAPTTYTALEQYWNPYSTSTDYLTNITLPTSTAIGNGWIFRGYKGGSTESDITAVTFTSDKAGTTFKANYNVYPQIRSIYERTLTMKYNGNGSTGGSTANQTTTQYYSSGYASSNKNNKEQISNPTITLKANGFTKTGYTFKNWAKGSASGTKYNASTSYTFAPGVSETNEETMYAIWDGNTYYVAYDCNGGTGTMSKSEHKYDVAKQLSASACKKGGSVFAKWNTKADNTGTPYTNQQSVKNLASEQSMNVTLYAQYSMCAAGTYAAAGAATCTSCPTGYTSLANSDSIEDCYLVTDAGKYVATANNNQITCAANGYCPGNVTVKYGSTGGRTACPTNYGTAPASSDAASDCYLTTTAGKYVATTKTAQTDCASGGYCPGGTTIYYGNTGGRTSCPTNYTSSPSGSDAINDCYLNTTAGKYVATANAAQVTCTANYYCAAGTKVNYGSTGGRTACPTNYGTSAEGSTSNTNCYLTTTAGKFVTSARSSQITCTANGYCPGGTKVFYGQTGGRAVCPTNYGTSSAGSTSNTNCYLTTAAGQFVASTNAAPTDCTSGGYCPGGTTIYYGNIGGRTTCPTNYTASASKATTQGQCYLTTAAGKFVTSARSSQITCTANGYCPGGMKVFYGQTGGRAACPTDYGTSAEGSKSNTNCYLTTAAGQFVATANAAPTNCTSGGYCPGGTTIYYGGTGGRTTCPTNYTASASKATTQGQCYLMTTAGKFVTSARSNQITCTANGFCPGGTKVFYGQTGGRQACPSGYGTAPEGSSSATNCYRTAYRTRSCSTAAACSSAGCASFSGWSAAGTFGVGGEGYYGSSGAYSGTYEKAECVNDWSISGGAGGDHYTCTKYTRYCTGYYRSESTCGCETWGEWGDYTTTACTPSNYCEQGTQYYSN